jgi:hypothetical protein
MTRVLIPSGALGLGYDRDALQAGIANRPDVIAIDGGSTDSGPSYLGRGVSKYSTASTKAEWRELMQARAEAGVPLIIGTAGTCGADQTVDWLFEITKDIAAELGQTLKVALLFSGQSPASVVAALSAGSVSPLPAAPPIDEDIVNNCTNIVALAGAEQIQAALQTGADIIIAGRTTDTAIIAALPLMRNDHPGAAIKEYSNRVSARSPATPPWHRDLQLAPAIFPPRFRDNYHSCPVLSSLYAAFASHN